MILSYQNYGDIENIVINGDVGNIILWGGIFLYYNNVFIFFYLNIFWVLN